jgi:hypothetical protein
MAHVWVEVFIDGQGWLRIDPSSFARNAGAVWAPPRRSLLLKIRMTLDSLNHTWNRVVISYDFERQLDVALKVGQKLQGVEPGRAIKVGLPYLMFLAGMAGISALLLFRKRLFPSREERLLRAFYRRVERDCGIVIERGRVGLFDIVALTANTRVREFADIYAGAVYRDRRLVDDEYCQLRQIVRDGFK